MKQCFSIAVLSLLLAIFITSTPTTAQNAQVQPTNKQWVYLTVTETHIAIPSGASHKFVFHKGDGTLTSYRGPLDKYPQAAFGLASMRADWINDLGAQGWELVSHTRTESGRDLKNFGRVWIFKKQK